MNHSQVQTFYPPDFHRFHGKTFNGKTCALYAPKSKTCYVKTVLPLLLISRSFHINILNTVNGAQIAHIFSHVYSHSNSSGIDILTKSFLDLSVVIINIPSTNSILTQFLFPTYPAVKYKSIKHEVHSICSETKKLTYYQYIIQFDITTIWYHKDINETIIEVEQDSVCRK